MLRPALAGAALCLFSAHGFGQNVPGGAVTLTWSTREIVASTGAPSSLSPGVIEPGEGIRFHLTVSYAPPSGTPLQWGGNPATVLAWGESIFELVGVGGTNGVFSRFTTAPEVGHNLSGPVSGPGFGTNIFQRGPFEPPPINPANPFVDLFTADWTPASYSPRTVSFFSRDGTTAGPANTLILDVNGPGGHSYDWGGATGIHTSTGPIVIIPSPAAAPALLLAALLRRKRRC